jgi:hypothetical protein
MEPSLSVFMKFHEALYSAGRDNRYKEINKERGEVEFGLLTSIPDSIDYHWNHHAVWATPLWRVAKYRTEEGNTTEESRRKSRRTLLKFGEE